MHLSSGGKRATLGGRRTAARADCKVPKPSSLVVVVVTLQAFPTHSHGYRDGAGRAGKRTDSGARRRRRRGL